MATVPTPYDWTAGVAPTAAALDAGVRDVGTFLLSPPSCSLYNSSAPSLTNNTWTLVTWDSESWDNDSMHSTASNTSRLVFATSGTYLLTVNAWFAANGTGGRGVNLTKSGAGTRAASNVVLSDGGVQATATAETLVAATVLRPFSAGDYVELWVWQASGGALNLSGGYNKTTLQAIRMGA